MDWMRVNHVGVRWNPEVTAFGATRRESGGQFVELNEEQIFLWNPLKNEPFLRQQDFLALPVKGLA